MTDSARSDSAWLAVAAQRAGRLALFRTGAPVDGWRSRRLAGCPWLAPAHLVRHRPPGSAGS